VLVSINSDPVRFWTPCSFFFFLENLFSIVTMHLNLHGFCVSLFRWFIGVFVLPMVSFIKLCHDKSFLWLHTQMSSIFTFFEDFVVFLDLVDLSKLQRFICLSCNFLMLMFE
jgi:hypothetical protein